MKIKLRNLFLIIFLFLFVFTGYSSILNSVIYEKVDSGIDIKLNFDNKFRYQIFKLDNPKRVVINLPSIKSKDNFKQIPVESSKINEVRYSQFNKNMARVVIELKEWLKYFPEKKGNNLVLHFLIKDQDFVKKEHDTPKKLSSLTEINMNKIDKDKIKLDFKIEGELNYTIKEENGTLSLELYNTKSNLSKKEMQGDGDIVKDLMINKINDENISVKISLNEQFPYDVDKTKDTISLIFEPAEKVTKSKINSIDNKMENGIVYIEFKTDDWIRYNEKQIGNENKIRMTFEDAVLSQEELNIPVRKGPVVEINNKIAKNDVVSDIILKENIKYEIYRNNNNIVMEVEQLEKENKQIAEDTSKKMNSGSNKENIKRSGQILKDISVQDANITSLLAEIARIAGYNIIMSKSVQGNVTIDLHNVSWEKAHDIILRTNGYSYKIDGNIIRVATLRELKEEVQAKKERQELEKAGPKEIRIIPISYADPDDISKTVTNTLSEDAKVTIDSRTNSLNITDVKNKLEQAEKLISYLDKPTSQVMIKAKFIKVSTTAQQNLGIRWQLNNNSTFESSMTNEGVDGGTDVIVNPGGATNSGQVVTSLLDTFNLNMKLNMMVTENNAEILASPKVTVLNNETAHFNAGKKIPITQLDESGNTVSQLQEIGIKLDVTPTINASNEVLLDIKPEVSDLLPPANGADIIISSNTAETKLIVKDGKTAVIGGLLRKDKTDATSGVPILKDIPIIGTLFKSRTQSNNTEEILIFVTPYIIRPNQN